MPKNNVEEINNRQQSIIDHLAERSTGGGGLKISEITKWLNHEGYEVTVKTVSRDLQVLCNDLKVEFDELPSGRRWYKNRSSNANKITNSSEAFLHVLVNRRMSHLLPQSLYRTLESKLHEAEKILNRPDQLPQRNWFKKIITLPNLLAQPELNTEIMRTIVDALLHEHLLIVSYKKRDQLTQENVKIMPLGIAELNDIYYLVVRYHGYENYRHLRIDRFVEAFESDEPFIYPADFQLQEYVDSGVFDFTNGKKIALKLKMSKFTSKHLIDQPISKDMNITDLDQELCIVEATVLGGERLQWWLQGMGCNVEVLEPPELRKAMTQYIKSLSELYQV